MVERVSINAIGDFFSTRKCEGASRNRAWLIYEKRKNHDPLPRSLPFFYVQHWAGGFPTMDNRTSGMSNRISLCSSEQQNRTSLCSRNNLIVLDLRWQDQIIQRWDRFSLDINFPEEQQRLPFILQSSRTIICPVWTIYWKKSRQRRANKSVDKIVGLHVERYEPLSWRSSVSIKTHLFYSFCTIRRNEDHN